MYEGGRGRVGRGEDGGERGKGSHTGGWNRKELRREEKREREGRERVGSGGEGIREGKGKPSKGWIGDGGEREGNR